LSVERVTQLVQTKLPQGQWLDDRPESHKIGDVFWAEEVCLQEHARNLLHFVLAVPPFEARSALKTWLYTIVRN